MNNKGKENMLKSNSIIKINMFYIAREFKVLVQKQEEVGVYTAI